MHRLFGSAAANIIEGFSENIQYYELKEAIQNGALFLDVRNPGELKLMAPCLML